MSPSTDLRQMGNYSIILSGLIPKNVKQNFCTLP